GGLYRVVEGPARHNPWRGGQPSRSARALRTRSISASSSASFACCCSRAWVITVSIRSAISWCSSAAAREAEEAGICCPWTTPLPAWASSACHSPSAVPVTVKVSSTVRVLRALLLVRFFFGGSGAGAGVDCSSAGAGVGAASAGAVCSVAACSVAACSVPVCSVPVCSSVNFISLCVAEGDLSIEQVFPSCAAARPLLILNRGGCSPVLQHRQQCLQGRLEGISGGGRVAEHQSARVGA